MAVSGCTRECAEAQSKDIGMIVYLSATNFKYTILGINDGSVVNYARIESRRDCKGLHCRTRFKHVGNRPISYVLNVDLAAIIWIKTWVIDKCQHLTATWIEHYN